MTQLGMSQSIWQRSLQTCTLRSVHACSMHTGKHPSICVNVGMRSVTHSNMQAGAQHAAHMAQD